MGQILPGLSYYPLALPQEERFSVIQYFVVCILVLVAMGVGYGAYCTYKRCSFVFAVKLTEWFVQIACNC